MKPALVLLAVIALASPAADTRAAVVALFDMEGGPDAGGDPNDAAAVANLAVSDLTEGPSGDMIEGDNTWASYAGSGEGVDTNTWWTRGSLTVSPAASNDYIQFTLTIAPGFELTIDLISVATMVGRNGSNGDMSFDLNVYSSADAFATPGTFHGDLVHPGGMPAGSEARTLDGADSIASLGVFTGAVTFRLFVEDTIGSGSTGKYIIIDTLTVEGAVSAIAPEGIPSPAALPAGVGLLGLLASRRRTR